jgi:cytoskeletal protein CcmA (bactofilin family)
MFKSNKSRSQRIDTLIGAGTRIIGDVHFTGGFHVDGHIKGNVDAPPDSTATLSVSDSGVVEGAVAVPNVVLNGTVKGDIIAHERVELGSTARVLGNLYYGLIEMVMGAEINGKLIHEPRKGQSGRNQSDAGPARSEPSEDAPKAASADTNAA